MSAITVCLYMYRVIGVRAVAYKLMQPSAFSMKISLHFLALVHGRLGCFLSHRLALGSFKLQSDAQSYCRVVELSYFFITIPSEASVSSNRKERDEKGGDKRATSTRRGRRERTRRTVRPEDGANVDSDDDDDEFYCFMIRPQFVYIYIYIDIYVWSTLSPNYHNDVFVWHSPSPFTSSPSHSPFDQGIRFPPCLFCLFSSILWAVYTFPFSPIHALFHIYVCRSLLYPCLFLFFYFSPFLYVHISLYFYNSLSCLFPFCVNVFVYIFFPFPLPFRYASVCVCRLAKKEKITIKQRTRTVK